MYRFYVCVFFFLHFYVCYLSGARSHCKRGIYIQLLLELIISLYKEKCTKFKTKAIVNNLNVVVSVRK